MAKEKTPEQITARREYLRQWWKNNKTKSKIYYRRRPKVRTEEQKAIRKENSAKENAAQNLRRTENIEEYRRREAENRRDPVFKAWRREYDRQYRGKYPDRVKQWTQNWIDKDPEKYRQGTVIAAAKRISIKRRSEGRLTPEDVDRVWALQDGKCVFFKTCENVLIRGVHTGFHIDHVEPLQPKDKTRGPGKHDVDNIQLLCAECNHRKLNIDPYIFAQQNGLLFCDIVDVAKPKKKKKAA